MRKLCCGSLAALIGLTMAGCVQRNPAMDPAAAVVQLSTGAPLLRCRADCVAEWRRAQPDAQRLDAAGFWSELAALVITVNYQDDLTLYYLARAAEGLGYPTAAVSYYRQSTYISGTSLSCQHESGVCGGAVLPEAALARIAALETEVRRSRSRSRPPQPSVIRTKPGRNGSKPVPTEERRAHVPAALERERQPPATAMPEPLQPATPAPHPDQSTAAERPSAGPEPPPPVQPASPPPIRMDPAARQFIEPPAAR